MGGNGRVPHGRRSRARAATMAIGVLAVLATAVATPATARVQDATWNGLVVAPEARCSPYESSDYRYSQSVEDRIVRRLGGVYGPSPASPAPNRARHTTGDAPSRRQATSRHPHSRAARSSGQRTSCW